MADSSQAAAALEGAELLLNAGPAGVYWFHATRGPAAPGFGRPPTSTPFRRSASKGIEVTDDGVERDGVTTFGALGVGGLKMKIHKACIAKLFERNDHVLDAESS